MPLATRAVSFDITQFTGGEYPAGGAFLRITPTRNSVVDGHLVPAVPEIYTPDTDGQGVADLAVSDDGDPQFAYSATVLVNMGAGVSGQYLERDFGLFSVPAGSGGLELSDLLAEGAAPAETSYWIELTEEQYQDFLDIAASIDGIEDQLALKADTTALTAAVDDLEDQLALKADLTALDAAVDDLEDQLDLKADTETVGDFETRGDAPYLIAFAAGSAVGDVILGGFRQDGALEAPSMQTETLTADKVVFPGLGELYNFPTREEGLFAITDANGVVQLMLGAGGEAASVPADDIRAYQPLIVMDGVTDQSLLLTAAHDAAAADGLRNLYIEGPIYAPDAMFLGDVQFLSRSGLGRLVGTYRKRVVPVNAATFVPQSGIVPSRHLKKFRAKLATATPSDPAVVVYMSDSWGNSNQLIGWQEQFEQILKRVFWQQFGPDAANVRIVNRAIGGTTWTDANGTVAQDSQTWATGVDLPWTDYVSSVELSDLTPTTRQPDLTMFMFGQNQWEVPDPDTIADMEDVLSTILTDNPDTDIVMITSSVPSAQSETRGTKASLEARQAWGAYTMAFADVHGYGKVDFSRAFDAAHWGFDPRALYFRRIAETAAISLPWTFPQECNDFAFQITADGATDTFWEQGDGVLTIPLSATEGNALILDLDASGNIAYTINTTTGVPQIARTVTDIDGVVGTSTPNLEICVLGAHLTIRWRLEEIYSGPVIRGWSLFTPSISYGDGGTLAASLTYAAVSEALTTMPSLTDEDAWGDASGDGGGNQENHFSVKARAAIFGEILAHTNFGG